MRIQVLDVELQLPPDHTVDEESSPQCTRALTVRGTRLGEIRSSLERLVLSRGYEIRHTPHGTFLTRGEQRIEVYDLDRGRLFIRVDDPEALPRSTVTTDGIRLAGISLRLPERAVIEPDRERHVAGSGDWSAKWRIYNVDARAVAEVLLGGLLKLGLRSAFIWAPKQPEDARWTVEASSSRISVRAHLDAASENLVLELAIVADEATARALLAGQLVAANDERIAAYEAIWTSENGRYALVEAGRPFVFDLQEWTPLAIHDENVQHALIDRLSSEAIRRIKPIDLELATEVRAAVAGGASFRAVVDLIHDRLDVVKYDKTPVMPVLRLAFLLELRDVADLVSCALFGNEGATTLSVAEQIFEERVTRRYRTSRT